MVSSASSKREFFLLPSDLTRSSHRVPISVNTHPAEVPLVDIASGLISARRSCRG